jgi:CAAX protease family protein
MEPESQPTIEEQAPPVHSPSEESWPDPATPDPAPMPYRGLRWIFVGSQGLRAGWSVVIFIPLLIFFSAVVGKLVSSLHLVGKHVGFSATVALVGEVVVFLGMLGAAALVARIEGRSIMDYNLTGPRRSLHFFSGLAAGFLALSALVAAMAAGGWLHFGPIALSGSAILTNAAVWACAFLVVGCVEEGIFRCYLQFTLTRGINFWWALGIIGAICLDLVIRTRGNGVWGVYAAAFLGLIPCLLLHLNKAEGSSFWQAAWVTSTVFGSIHTGNGGENWIGIFAAAAIGFVFCVSIRVTGSAWWAIGCHAAWDWAETYFYGTADSGLAAQGHYLSASAAGNPLWSGGTDGPEGSLLVLGIILLLLVVLLALYGRRKTAPLTMPDAQQGAV